MIPRSYSHLMIRMFYVFLGIVSYFKRFVDIALSIPNDIPIEKTLEVPSSSTSSAYSCLTIMCSEIKYDYALGLGATQYGDGPKYYKIS